MRCPDYLPSPSTPFGDRSGLQPPRRPTTPSADFCAAVRAPRGSLSPPGFPGDTVQISWGKPRGLPRTPAGFTVQALDGYGLRDFLPARPTCAASYPVAVRQVAISFHASFRRSLAVPPLRFTRASPPSGCTGDFHPQTAGHAQHTGRFAPLRGGLRPSLTVAVHRVAGIVRPGRRNGAQPNQETGEERYELTGTVSGPKDQTRPRMTPPRPTSIGMAGRHEIGTGGRHHVGISGRIRRNAQRGSIRQGGALLPGLFRCARCGKKLQVSYGGKKSHSQRYACRGAFSERAELSCISFGGMRIDRAVASEILERVQPFGIEAAIAAANTLDGERSDKRRQHENAIEQARFEVARAFRQYDAADPENRLVAADLERR